MHCQKPGAVFLFLLTVVLAGIQAPSQAATSPRGLLFDTLDMTFKEADRQQARTLSPRAYAKARRAYDSADNGFRKGRSQDRISRNISTAQEAIGEAIENARLAQQALKSTLSAREDAVKASASARASDLWDSAESSLGRAISSLEGGSLATAGKRGGEAEALYRRAELVAIKNQLLGELRALIDKTRDLRVDRYAPRTLAKATGLLTAATNSLDRSRYEWDPVRKLVAEGIYEANHATYIAGVALRVAERTKTVEDIVLEWEQPLKVLAREMDVRADLSTGHERTTSGILQAMTNQKILLQPSEPAR